MAEYGSNVSCFNENYRVFNDDFENTLEVLGDEKLINETADVISDNVSNFCVVFPKNTKSQHALNLLVFLTFCLKNRQLRLKIIIAVFLL